MADEKLVHGHELFLGQIEAVFTKNHTDPDFLKRCCDNLAKIIIPANSLQEVEGRLVDLLVGESETGDASAEVAWKKVCILRETVRMIRGRQKPKPKAKPKKKAPDSAIASAVAEN
ncbi:MAG: hypothetical protein ABIJ84_04330 [bacterium]